MTDEQRQRIWEIENSCDGRTELAKLRELLSAALATWERLTAGIELPEYPVTQFQPKDLERELVKLREDMEDIEGYDQMIRDRLRQETELRVKSEAENAKLRELARAAWRCIHTGASCSDCRLIAGGCTLQSAMRELGIEVEQ